MRHLRIPSQNLENLAAFKKHGVKSRKVAGLLKRLNRLERAIEYFRNRFIYKRKPRLKLKRRKAEEAARKKLKTQEVVEEKPTTLKNSKLSILTCQICDKVEKSKKDMLQHLETHVGAPISCLKCKRTFNGSVSFKWHLNVYCHSKMDGRYYKFKCDQCPREFVTKRTLIGHLQGHKRNNCTYCDKVLTKRLHLIRHVLEVHSIKLERAIHKCDRCEKRYIKKRNLFYHMTQHVPDKFVCLECGAISETVEESNGHKLEHDSQKHFHCPKCEEKFSRRQQYLFHLERHDRYKCITCNESFASRMKVLKHKHQGHQVQGLNPNFLCPHCPLIFQRESRLFMHMKKHTTDPRNINCKYCKKSFNSPYMYYKHCLTINHEKYSPEISDVVCETCGKHFVKKHELKQHVYRVHNTSRQQFSCDYCDYKTYSKGNMKRHAALHFKQDVEFSCEHCGKKCNSLASLKDHISYNHVQKKQFSCDKCDKSFKRNSELVRHQNSHSDDRPHTCMTCGKTYKRLNHLKRHEEKSHEIVKGNRRIKKVDDDKTVEEANVDFFVLQTAETIDLNYIIDRTNQNSNYI